MRIKIFFLLLIPFIITGIEDVFAESNSFTVAARSYHDLQVFMNSGDQISFAISVSGGTDDAIDYTHYSPTGSVLNEGVIYDQFSDIYTADVSGTYTFRFDNTGSLISNKGVNFSYELQQNTFRIYVDSLPNLNHNAGNSVYESTEWWKELNPHINFYKVDSPQDANLRIQWVKEFGGEHIGYALGSQFIEVGIGDSNCKGNWQPYSAEHVNWIMKHEIGHVLGLEHASDENSIMYPIAPTTQYGLVEEQFILAEGYVQFVPFCASKQTTSFGYNVKSDDPTYGFDVYVVPSAEEFDRAVDGNSFSHYSSTDCFGEGYLEYGGICRGVSNQSGLLIVIENKQTSGLTQLTIKNAEDPVAPSRLQTTKTATISPDSPEEFEDSQALDDFLSEFQDEQNNLENERLTPGEKLAKELSETISESRKQNSQEEIKTTTQQKVRCGEGTILKEGKCVLDVENSNSSQGGCLIATATYGTELAPQVQTLREIRDNSLLGTESGTNFMKSFNDFYYSFSPAIADYERENPVFREAVKVTITPMIASLSILNYVDIDSEAEVLGYGISLIALNIGMYFVAPAIVISRIRKL